MLLQYCSDLHLEFRENKQWLARNPLQPVAPVLILAGDIIPFYELSKHGEFFDQLSDSFEIVYWVPGNHEYYHSDIAERSGSFCEKIRENVLLVNNQAILHDGVKLVFSTLWSKISEAREWQIERSLNDFQVIRNGDRFFSVEDVNRLHAESMDFLSRELGKDDGMKTVVVTHHAPTFLHYPPKYKDSELNEGFATELYDFIEGSGVKA
ncbi:metallophosphoesterase [Terrimonas sp. NA20]|uniref:Metallophosphoesterase n=1 Tax=Terrimonas ginsenosidimutans TaxID=2908004 RepID=A0ABS9KKI7_9BACT|nr:metallophosphoesterase [Terrimonas ginsenosidimutans]MCG2612814.1 metallophosphoesterase [Terrimonas ginsenosidimutans]